MTLYPLREYQLAELSYRYLLIRLDKVKEMTELFSFKQALSDLRRADKQKQDTAEVLRELQGQRSKLEDERRDAEERAFSFEERLNEAQDDLKISNERIGRLNIDVSII